MVLIRLLFTAFAHMSLVSFMSPCLFHVPQNSSLEQFQDLQYLGSNHGSTILDLSSLTSDKLYNN